MKMNVLLVFAALFFSGCGNDEKNEIVLPTNLQVQTEISTSVNGKVDITATAVNAKYFSINFGETGSVLTTIDGTASYTYTRSGTFNIQIQAHATPNQYISKTETVVIELPSEPISNEGYTTPESYEGYTLVWADEFDGTTLNTANWTHEIGTGSNGWGNNELQYYRENNTTVENGFLIITAKKENFSGSAYTSSRMVTKGKKDFQYGRVDIRARLPQGQGIWPALWMLGSSFPGVNWPACGEIDIMEMIGGNGREKTVHGTLHWDNNGSHACTCDKPGYTLSSGTFADKFHVFTIIWDATEIKWYVDDVLFNTINITPAGLSEFHAKFFFIFNVAVGGNWPGNPNAATVFPQRMMVDYIRVFQPE
jgi:beta-glucanase (GH16 family)